MAHMGKPKSANLAAVAAMALILGACSQGGGMTPSTSAPGGGGESGAASAEKAFDRFPDLPVPTNADMDVQRTIVFGGGESWFGQLGLDTRHDTNTMFDFYKQELPGFGWQEITSVRALVSVLTYERQGRVLSIQLEKATILGTKATLTVSPRGGAQPAMN